METKVTQNYFSSNNIGEDFDSKTRINKLEIEDEIPTIHRIEELCQKLSSVLDLDEIDAHIYLNLLRMGPNL